MIGTVLFPSVVIYANAGFWFLLGVFVTVLAIFVWNLFLDILESKTKASKREKGGEVR